MGYIIAAIIAGAIARVLSGNVRGWSLLLSLAGWILLAVWIVAWTRQEFLRYEVILDHSERSAEFLVTPFPGKTRTRVIRAEEVQAVLVLGMNPGRLILDLKDSEKVPVDSSTEPEGLHPLAQELARTLGVPLRNTAPE